MDQDRFDTLTRALAAAASRRGLFARLGAGVLAALPLALGGENAAAKKCKKKCGQCKKCNRKAGKCKPQPNDTPCGTCRACQDGKCEPLPLGVSCGTGKSCQRGVCADCDAGLSPCTPGSFNTCCSGKCSQAQPDVYLCEPHG